MRRTAVSLALVLLFAATATALERTHDESFDFSSVRSFAWVEEPGWKVNPVADRRIRSAVESTLSAKGYSITDAGSADLLLDYRAAVRDRLQIDEVWRGRRIRGPVVQVWDVSSYAEGTLLLDLLTAADGELVWRGTISGALSRETAEKRIKRIGDGWAYGEVASRAHPCRLGELEVLVLDLRAVIESKQAAGREKDTATLPVLRRTLELRRG